MTSSSPKHLSKFDSILWFWTKTGGIQFTAHCLRGAVIGRLEERWVQQGKPKLARRSFYLNQEKKSVLGTKPWSFWAEVLLKSPDHVQAPSCRLNQLTMALNWTYRAFFRELAQARALTNKSSRTLKYILCRNNSWPHDSGWWRAIHYVHTSRNIMMAPLSWPNHSQLPARSSNQPRKGWKSKDIE